VPRIRNHRKRGTRNIGVQSSTDRYGKEWIFRAPENRRRRNNVLEPRLDRLRLVGVFRLRGYASRIVD
jgi:hypothetical protein